MRLFIAEKPSLAAEIAKGLGSATKKTGYFEIGNDIVTWAYGHVLRQKNPEEYNEKYKVWKMEDLPIIPSAWELVVSENCRPQFAVIKKLILQADEIVNAGDPDREGELLVDEILDFVGNVNPVKRILLNALDERSVRKALHDLRDSKDFIGLKNSALARSRADWIVGMNLSRAYTVAARNGGYQQTLSIGRVKTPTMALVVRRENEIKNFLPVTHYQLQVDWQHDLGIIPSLWNPSDKFPGLDSEGRLLDQDKAEEMFKKIHIMALEKGAAIAQCEETEKKEPQRLPYSLSALQIAAGKKYGYDPQLVLDTMQELYEKKVTTYPRSDCDFLPENQFADAKTIVQNLVSASDIFAPIIDSVNLSIKSRAWNDKKISAHHAIIPTTKPCDFASLTAIQKNMYAMVVRAYIAQFYDIHIYTQTKLSIHCCDEVFTAHGKTIRQIGWKALYRSEQKQEEESSLPAVTQGELLKYDKGKINKKITTAPKRFTPSSLLEAMKQIHKYVKDPNLKAQLKTVSGIGTEATRAGIIDDLIKKSFLRIEKKYLFPTELSEMMVKILPDEMTYPDMTAIWEDQLEQIVHNEVSFTAFFEKQKAILFDLVKTARNIKIDPPEGAIACPACKSGTLIKRNGKNGIFWACNNYPQCKTSFADKNGKPVIFKCPHCEKGYLRRRKGKKGFFWSCNQYPNCKTTFNDKKGKPDK
ncbi:MAG: DNA topoisomerase 3 [Smithella sp.]